MRRAPRVQFGVGIFARIDVGERGGLGIDRDGQFQGKVAGLFPHGSLIDAVGERLRSKPCKSKKATFSCSLGSRASSTVFSQLLPFFTITRFWGVCFRSQRLRLAHLRGEFPDGFLTVVAATAMLYGLRSTCL